MSALPAMLHALEALHALAEDSLHCPDCGIHLDECTCDLIVVKRCEQCWHYLEQCECECCSECAGGEQCDDCHETAQRDGETNSSWLARVYGI